MARKSTSRKATASPASKSRARSSKALASSTARLKKLDLELVKRLHERARLTIEHLSLLPDPQRAMYDPVSDDALWSQLEKQPGALPFAALRGIYRELLSASRRSIKASRVAYLGPQFSYTHLAAIERFGKWADLIPVTTISAVFEEVHRGHAEFGIVPIEIGAISTTADTRRSRARASSRVSSPVRPGTIGGPPNVSIRPGATASRFEPMLANFAKT